MISGKLFSGRAPAKQTIVVAKQEIPAYTAITPDGCYDRCNLEYLINTADKPKRSGTIAQSPIGAGQIVYKNQISRIDLIAGGNCCFTTLKDGQRAMIWMSMRSRASLTSQGR